MGYSAGGDTTAIESKLSALSKAILHPEKLWVDLFDAEDTDLYDFHIPVGTTSLAAIFNTNYYPGDGSYEIVPLSDSISVLGSITNADGGSLYVNTVSKLFEVGASSGLGFGITDGVCPFNITFQGTWNAGSKVIFTITSPTTLLGQALEVWAGTYTITFDAV
ncbi:MAG: hypothetical protein US20_C0005G0011 [Candidatus Pacebacteria bacterium GW2011_GWF1_36_5]|nr:MAG: hypothetical protein US20_C0005G0011 [Candidatus Pacebacteria bacterium GW2011_GWF1_36_5]